MNKIFEIGIRILFISYVFHHNNLNVLKEKGLKSREKKTNFITHSNYFTENLLV